MIDAVAQLATFSSLEQLMPVNKNLAGLATGQANLVNSQALTLIGKDALVEAGGTVRVQHGKPDDIVYAIGAGASTATVKIVDAQGVVRRVIELDPKRPGRVDLGWDGRDGNGAIPPSGVLTDIQIPLGLQAPPQATQNLSLVLNLSANARVDDPGTVTGYAADSASTSSSQDGYGVGTLRTLSVDPSGLFSGVFTNGVPLELAHVGLARFNNANGLVRNGQSTFIETNSSGAATIGGANQGGRGAVSSNSLELSNVDTTTDSLIQEARNLKR